MLNSYDYSNYFNARNKALLATMFETGIRSKETIDLKNDDILSDRIFIRGKGKKQRYVPSSINLKRILNHYEKIKSIYFHIKDNVADNYFLGRTGKSIFSEQMVGIYKQAGKKAGVRDKVRCSSHTMRHTFASEMVKKTDIYTISRLHFRKRCTISIKI